MPITITHTLKTNCCIRPHSLDSMPTQGLTHHHPASLHMYSHIFGVRSCCAIGPIPIVGRPTRASLFVGRSRRAQCYLYALASADSPSPRANYKYIHIKRRTCHSPPADMYMLVHASCISPSNHTTSCSFFLSPQLTRSKQGG
ncbi:hypothetical protein CCMA1212_009775 [Trichoderma ghanense]|uniref:Uncharacterized protein n=1 Tax=Trichoderma ghanense TaxID=65468 RepID=A0ABY2GS12_9HYPO